MTKFYSFSIFLISVFLPLLVNNVTASSTVYNTLVFIQHPFDNCYSYLYNDFINEKVGIIHSLIVRNRFSFKSILIENDMDNFMKTGKSNYVFPIKCSEGSTVLFSYLTPDLIEIVKTVNNVTDCHHINEDISYSSSKRKRQVGLTEDDLNPMAALIKDREIHRKQFEKEKQQAQETTQNNNESSQQQQPQQQPQKNSQIISSAPSTPKTNQQPINTEKINHEASPIQSNTNGNGNTITETKVDNTNNSNNNNNNNNILQNMDASNTKNTPKMPNTSPQDLSSTKNNESSTGNDNNDKEKSKFNPNHRITPSEVIENTSNVGIVGSTGEENPYSLENTNISGNQTDGLPPLILSRVVNNNNVNSEASYAELRMKSFISIITLSLTLLFFY